MAENGNWSLAIMLLEARINEMKKDSDANNNAFFMCSMALIIFFMQCGFAFLEAGAVRSKNTTNILIKNVLDSIIVIICYWATGWAFAYGDDTKVTGNSFIGTSEFFLAGQTDYPKFFFQYVFAATAATIVSGAVCERCEFVTYIAYCSIISMLVYPVLTHWGWSSKGWLVQGMVFNGIQISYIDFAGSGMVHLCGGTISFIAAYMIGPRIGRFPSKGNEEPSLEIQGHSVPFAALGGFILMFGFLAFNGGSTANISEPHIGNTVALAMTNTIMSGSFAAIIYLVVYKYIKGKWTCLLTINAALTGMVAACAGCNRTQPWGSVVVGTGAGLFYLALSTLMVKLKIDDPLDAFAVHFGGGLWGLISACLVMPNGLFYATFDGIFNNTGSIEQSLAQLGWNILGALSITAWSTVTMIPVFFILKKFNLFRVPPEVEIKGLDIFKHGEAAYPIYAYGHGWDDIETTVGKTEISIEELAKAYERKTSVLPVIDSRKISFYHNRHRFEHPENHQVALKKKQLQALKEAEINNDKLVARGPTLEFVVDKNNGTHNERF